MIIHEFLWIRVAPELILLRDELVLVAIDREGVSADDMNPSAALCGREHPSTPNVPFQDETRGPS
jgi:hypothetical protein